MFLHAVCGEDEGMDDEATIPDENIISNDETNPNVGNLRPDSTEPYESSRVKPEITVRLPGEVQMGDISLSDTPTNVEGFTIEYYDEDKEEWVEVPGVSTCL